MLVVNVLLALFTRVALQDEVYVSPFNSTKSDYKEFETRLLILESQYCGSLCGFDLVRESMPGNQNCGKCWCDGMCHQYKDCCPDVRGSKKDRMQTRCTSTSVKEDEPTGGFYRMTASCPVDWPDDDVRRTCGRPKKENDIRFYVPVTDLTSKLTYKNRYCAECQGVNATVDWQITAKCKENSAIFAEARSVQELFALAKTTIGCNVVSEPGGIPEAATRQCVPLNKDVHISTCNVTGLWRNYDADVERACYHYERVVLGIYRNMFCRICNGDSWDVLLSENRVPRVLFFASVPLTAIIQFGNYAEEDPQAYPRTVTKTGSMSTCNQSQIYDPSMCACRDVICAKGKYLASNECRSYVPKSNTIGYRLCFSIKTTLKSSTDETRNRDLKALLKRITSTDLPRASDIVIITESLSRYVGIYECAELLHVHIQTEISAITPTVRDQKNVQSSLLGFVSVIAKCLENSIGGSVRFSGKCIPHLTSKLNAGRFNSDVLTKGCEFPSAMSFRGLIKHVRYVDFDRFLICPHVTFKRMDFKQHSVDSLHNKCTTLFRSGDLDNSIINDEDNNKMCVEDFLARNESDNDTICAHASTEIDESMNMMRYKPLPISTPLGVLSVVCTCVSLVFLLITFVIYSLFRELRTTGGVCNMGLVVNMFLAQVLYEFGMEQNEQRVLCSAIGALIHFFWLAVILWTNACVVQCFLKLCFPIKALIMAAGSRATFIIASVYSYGISALAVGITILTHELILGDVGYGGRICYFSTANGQTFAFLLPVGLLTVSNIVMYAVTVVKLRKMCLMSSGKDHRISLLACVKLSTISGLAWISAYLYTATSMTALAYVFTVLVGGQGFFLFLSFMVNGRVFKLFQNKLRARKQDNYTGNQYSRRKSSTDTRL